MPTLIRGCLAACLLLVAAPAMAGSFTYITLAPPGVVRQSHIGLNTANQVAGAYTDKKGAVRGWVWTHGKLTATPFALDVIGDSGVAAGVSFEGGKGPDFFVTLYDTVTGGINRLPRPVFTEGFVPKGEPFFANPAGLVAGHATNKAGVVVGFLAHGAKVTYLKPDGTSETDPTGIDDSGAVVAMVLQDDLKWSNAVYRHGKYVKFNVPDSYTITRFITGATIGGDYRLTNGLHGFTRTGASTISYDFPQATGTSVADTIGSEVAGYYLDSAGVKHGFVQLGGTYYTIDPPGSASTDIRRLNSAGSLAGFYSDHYGSTHAFVAVCKPAQAPCTK
jgi:hypothetical protein